MLAPSIRRGLAAGLLAGVVAGLFALLVGEVPLSEAIALEQTASAGHGTEDALVSRTTQRTLLPVATAVVGAAFGGLFGVLFAVIRRSIEDRDDWRAVVKLGAVAWAVAVLVPWLVAPPDPPGVGELGEFGSRSSWYLGAIALAVAGAVGLRALALVLRRRGVRTAHRQVLVGSFAVLGFGALVAVAPASGWSGGPSFPPDLLWRFRLASLATQSLLWAGITTMFGLLWDRHAGRSPVSPTSS